MAHGHEDWGIQTGGLKPVLDDAELAARLLKGAGGNYRGGNVLYFSVMQNGVAEFPVKTLPGTPAAIKLNSKYADYGPACLQVVTDNVANAETIVGKDIPVNHASKLGLEVSVFYLTAADSRVILRLVTYFASGRNNTFTVRINADAGGDDLDVDYKDSGGNWQDLATLGRITVARGFFSYKMIVDNSVEASPKYYKFLCNGVETDMSTFNAQTTTGGAAYVPVTRCEFGHEAIAAVSRTIYLGLFMFTINEP